MHDTSDALKEIAEIYSFIINSTESKYMKEKVVIKGFRKKLFTMLLAVMLIIIGITPINVHAASYGKYESHDYYVIAVEGCMAYFGTIRSNGCMTTLVNDNIWWNNNEQSGEISVGYFEVRCNCCRNQRKIAICKKGSTASADHAGVENGTCKYCGQDVHDHTYETTWTYDSTNHWHVATCEHTDLKSDEAAHTLSDWNDGVKTCECGYTETCSHDRLTGICGVCGKDLGSPAPAPAPTPTPTPDPAPTSDPTPEGEPSKTEQKETASVGTPQGPSKSAYEERMDSLLNEIILESARAKKTGSVKTIYIKDVTTLSLSLMKALKDNPNVILDMTYTYKGVAFHVTIPGGSLVYVDESIPWYGPVWLYTYYGKGALTNTTENARNVYIVQSGDTLRKISSELSVPLDALIKKNPKIKNIDKIYIGDKITY